MASERTQHGPGPKQRSHHNQHYHERNRTFSSTTTEHYKNKLSQIGIEKDLREILDRKRCPNEKKDSSTLPGQSGTEMSPRRVRFEDEKNPVRRSKSFTSGDTFDSRKIPHDRNKYVKDDNFVQKKYTSDNKYLDNSDIGTNLKNSKNHKKSRNNYFDLQHPTNIKIELKTDSGNRKCVVDLDVPISSVKCNLRSSRSILKNAESKVKRTEIETKAVIRNEVRDPSSEVQNTVENNRAKNKGKHRPKVGRKNVSGGSIPNLGENISDIVKSNHEQN